MGVGNRDEQIMQTQHRQQEQHMHQLMNDHPVQEQPTWQEYKPPVVEGSKELRKQLRNQRLFEQWSKLTQEQQAELRAKSEYIHGHVENKDQIIHAPHAKSHTIKHMNDVITSVLGDQVYDNVTRIKTGETEEQRTVQLHHSRGTRLVSQGKTVFKFDLVGSGFKQWRKDQNGFAGKVGLGSEDESLAEDMAKLDSKLAKLTNVKEQLNRDTKEMSKLRKLREKLNGRIAAPKVYGSSVEVNGKRLKYVLKKSDTTGRKVSYSIAGSQAGLNLGDYSIENVNSYFYELSKQELDPIFRQWKLNGKKGPDIHLLVRGHSRGGVAAIEGPMMLQKWLNETWPDYADSVKFEITQYDPVAGFLSNRGANDKIDIRGDRKELEKKGMAPLKNAETTLIYSLHTDQKFFFRPQNVKGAKRVILTPYRHNMGMDQLDETQIRELKNSDGQVLDRKEKAHKTGYTDAQTGEVYRQSGISELEGGLYILDQSNILIKVTNYEDAERIIDRALEGTHLQWRRHGIIRDVVKAWFDENQNVDQVNQQSEEAHEEMKAQMRELSEHRKHLLFLSGRDSSKMTAVKQAMERLNEQLDQQVSGQSEEQSREIRRSYQELIDRCAEYISRRTPLTPTGRARKRMVEQLKKKCEAELAYVQDYERMLKPVLETYQGEPVTWDRVIAGARSVRMNRLSAEEQAQIAELKNGASTEFTRGDKTYTFRRENELIADYTTVRKNVAARELSELMGLSGLYAEAKFAETQLQGQKVRGVLTRQDGGLPLADVLETVNKDPNIKLEFSPEASGQMQIMPLLDMLMGTVMREERDFEVQLEKTQAEDKKELWTVTRVVSKEHEKLFAERTLRDMIGKEITLEDLFDHPLTDTDRRLLDRLDDISPELLDFRLCHALTKKELYFMKDRLHTIQQLWRREKLWG